MLNDNDLNRYSRQVIIPNFDEEGQEKLLKTNHKLIYLLSIFQYQKLIPQQYLFECRKLYAKYLTYLLNSKINIISSSVLVHNGEIKNERFKK